MYNLLSGAYIIYQSILCIYWRALRSGVNKVGFMCMYCDTLRKSKNSLCIYRVISQAHGCFVVFKGVQ